MKKKENGMEKFFIYTFIIPTVVGIITAILYNSFWGGIYLGLIIDIPIMLICKDYSSLLIHLLIWAIIIITIMLDIGYQRRKAENKLNAIDNSLPMITLILCIIGILGFVVWLYLR